LRAAARIGEFPRGQPRTEDGPEEPETREFFIARFEIRVIYAIWKDEAVILALVHARMKPSRWLHRLAELT
jgi:plasmid stabilization system protein ParE